MAANAKSLRNSDRNKRHVGRYEKKGSTKFTTSGGNRQTRTAGRNLLVLLQVSRNDDHCDNDFLVTQATFKPNDALYWLCRSVCKRLVRWARRDCGVHGPPAVRFMNTCSRRNLMPLFNSVSIPDHNDRVIHAEKARARNIRFTYSKRFH